ncbi:MarR family transcriptional regulator [Streptomyces sp. NE06-03E]|uniref:MarR family transcriptional regulator n=1 Tax=Streptomyces silvae TaxID=2803812 RepID=A0ABU8AET0_9ACTN|nr:MULTISPECIES: MarR family transcriptional regulator [unclassified Streptomyces]WSS66102.1 MarR family transcriptional regulator [Streptomyces sp. NBC_01177]WSS73097.1 MarR family transcriptional regulator [Streptomyces sp. NBC_01175]WSS80139.1 MarR family transcriptional regulator [Streptomyces sp. NBC_01174]MDX3059519.1 MarR family transcriptional regulator [Streptomyces sp. NE06-03E]MDX3329083.1 MarR family transcriptional regulator [Streptomyces sp. ME02-6979-3A]
MTPPPTPASGLAGLPDTELLKLDHQVCFSLQAASRAFGGVYREALKDLGLTYPQYLAMMVLWEHGPLPVKTIGERLHLDSGTLSPLLKRLETAGLVRRERSPEDERSVTVHLTDAGAGLRERALPVPRAILEATGMSVEEVLDLQRTLARLTESLGRAA